MLSFDTFITVVGRIPSAIACKYASSKPGVEGGSGNVEGHSPTAKAGLTAAAASLILPTVYQRPCAASSSLPALYSYPAWSRNRHSLAAVRHGALGSRPVELTAIPSLVQLVRKGSVA